MNLEFLENLSKDEKITIIIDVRRDFDITPKERKEYEELAEKSTKEAALEISKTIKKFEGEIENVLKTIQMIIVRGNKDCIKEISKLGCVRSIIENKSISLIQPIK